MFLAFSRRSARNQDSTIRDLLADRLRANSGMARIFGSRNEIHRLTLRGGSKALARNFREGPAVALKHGVTLGEFLPAADRDVDIGRVELDGVTGSPRLLGGDYGRAEPENGS